MNATVPAPRRRSRSRFVLHYFEMVIAMAIGMALRHPLALGVLDALGRTELMTIPESGALISHHHGRGHGGAHAPARGRLATRPGDERDDVPAVRRPLRADVVRLITVPELYEWGHLLRFPAMAGAMLLRREEYARC